MAYTIEVTDHNSIVVGVGDTDTSTSLTLIGKNTPNYGLILNQNLVDLLQNFAGASTPNGPVEGQLWYNSSTGRLSVYNNSIFKTISQLSFGAVPLTPYSGELWWDTSNSLLKIYDGASWVAIGPNYISTSAAAIADVVTDNASQPHDVLQLVVSGTVVAIIAKQNFTARVTYNGLTDFVKGINLVPNGGFSSDYANVGVVRTNTLHASTLLASSIGNSTATMTADTITANVGTFSTGLVLPSFTTTEKNAISTLTAGLVLFDSTLGKMSYYDGSGWINL